MSDLRSRLYGMRAGLVETLAREGVDGGMLALLGTVHGAIAAVDAVPGEVAPADRAVVSDDGEVLRLMLYSTDGAACGIELDPVHAVDLAGRLIAAASAKLVRMSAEKGQAYG